MNIMKKRKFKNALKIIFNKRFKQIKFTLNHKKIPNYIQFRSKKI